MLGFKKNKLFIISLIGITSVFFDLVIIFCVDNNIKFILQKDYIYICKNTYFLFKNVRNAFFSPVVTIFPLIISFTSIMIEKSDNKIYGISVNSILEKKYSNYISLIKKFPLKKIIRLEKMGFLQFIRRAFFIIVLFDGVAYLFHWYISIVYIFFVSLFYLYKCSNFIKIASIDENIINVLMDNVLEKFEEVILEKEKLDNFQIDCIYFMDNNYLELYQGTYLTSDIFKPLLIANSTGYKDSPTVFFEIVKKLYLRIVDALLKENEKNKDTIKDNEIFVDYKVLCWFFLAAYTLTQGILENCDRHPLVFSSFKHITDEFYKELYKSKEISYIGIIFYQGILKAIKSFDEYLWLNCINNNFGCSKNNKDNSEKCSIILFMLLQMEYEYLDVSIAKDYFLEFKFLKGLDEILNCFDEEDSLSLCLLNFWFAYGIVDFNKNYINYDKYLQNWYYFIMDIRNFQKQGKEERDKVYYSYMFNYISFFGGN